MCSWPRADQLRLGPSDGGKHQTTRDLVCCCCYRGLSSAIIERFGDCVPSHSRSYFLSLLYSETHMQTVRYTTINQNCEIRVATTDIYAANAAGAAGFVAGVFLLRPQRTPRRSPSMSSPLAHASAARSAETRSLKFTNAHLKLATMR